MANIHADCRFAFRSDTAANWQVGNPVLLSGEIGTVTNGSETEKMKIGDGVTPWNSLSWFKGPKGEQGIQGFKGEKGEKGNDGITPTIDQTYSATSQNAQSGAAIAQAISESVGDINTILAMLVDGGSV